MGEQVSEQLEIIPAKVYVVQHIRHKYACRKCQDKVVIAKMPDQPIDKGKSGPGMLAEVLVNKYQDHLPLYRQSQRLSRYGIHLSRSTLCGWVMQSAALLAPLVDAMKERTLIPSTHLFSDDTHIKTLTYGEEKNIKTGRFWVYSNKESEDYPACTVYQYTTTREAEGPSSFLKGFKGFLQADAYAGYDHLYKATEQEKASIVEVACWAHTRRKFYEIAETTSKRGLAHEALEFIQQLYQVEKYAQSHSLNYEDIKKWRNTHAPPILRSFHEWLQKQQERVLPKTKLAGAIGYALNHWEALNSYLLEGYLEIDNNRSERSMKPLAVGRKNYLFVGSITGGEAAAVIYSLIATCQQHKINPWAYFKDVLTRLPNHPYSKIEELLPYNWKPVSEDVPIELLFDKAV
jgi:transposase